MSQERKKHVWITRDPKSKKPKRVKGNLQKLIRKTPMSKIEAELDKLFKRGK